MSPWPRESLSFITCKMGYKCHHLLGVRQRRHPRSMPGCSGRGLSLLSGGPGAQDGQARAGWHSDQQAPFCATLRCRFPETSPGCISRLPFQLPGGGGRSLGTLPIRAPAEGDGCQIEQWKAHLGLAGQPHPGAREAGARKRARLQRPRTWLSPGGAGAWQGRCCWLGWVTSSLHQSPLSPGPSGVPAAGVLMPTLPEV